MQRVTVSIDSILATSFDALIEEQGYRSRSEAVRDLVRKAVEERQLDADARSHCVATLSYVFDYQTRALAKRLLDLKHDNHDLVVSSNLVVLDHVSSMENVVLKGPTTAVRTLADLIRSERGVRFASINLIGVDQHNDHDSHSHDHKAKSHLSPVLGS